MAAESAGTDWADRYRSEDTAAGYERRFRGPLRSWNNRWVWRAVAAELRRLGGDRWPAVVLDAPAGTGRFTADLRARGSRVIHVDRSLAMLHRLRQRHGPGLEVAGDLRQPPLARHPEAVVLCLRLMQHLGPAERVAVLGGLRRLASSALVAYYPGWHYKDFLRRLRYRLGLPHRTLRPRLRVEDLQREAAAAGWQLVHRRRVLPLLSEYVLLSLKEA